MLKSVTPGQKLVLTLFALVFGTLFSLIGFQAGIAELYQQGVNWWTVRSYVPVPAQVVSSELAQHRGRKGGTSYLAKASFSYQYQGREYVAARPSFSETADNIGDFQQRVHRELSDARERRVPVQLWVDPQAPEHSVYDRTIRWQMLLLHLPFAVMFTGVGVGAWFLFYYLWCAGRKPTLAERVQAGERPRIQPNTSGVLILLGFAFFWNCMAWPIAMLAFTQGPAGINAATIVGTLFPAAGLFLVWFAWYTWRKARLAGTPVLEISGWSPLKARIRFQPAVGLRSPASELTHEIAIDAMLVQEVRMGNKTRTQTLWEERVVEKRVPRGTDVLEFSVTMKPAREKSRHQIVVHLAGTSRTFDL